MSEPNVRIRVHKEPGQPLSAEEWAKLRAALATAEPITPERLREWLSNRRRRRAALAKFRRARARLGLDA